MSRLSLSGPVRPRLMPDSSGSSRSARLVRSRERDGVIGSVAVMGSLTLLSRLLGLVRDQVIAWLLGTGVQADAYGVAIKLPNLFRRLMGEGAMSAAYVPVLSGRLEEAGSDPGRRREVWRFVSRFTYLLAATLLVLTILGVVLSPWVVRFVAPGFHAAPAPGASAFDVTVTLNRIVFPYLFFVCLAALAMGTLNALGSFGPPAFTPVLLNLSIIGCALTLHAVVPMPVYALGIGYLAGGVLQLLWQVPFLRRRGARLLAVTPRPDAAVADVGRRMGVGAVGAGVYQINVLVGTMVASSLPAGSISSLYYADRLNELVLGVWAVSVATVVLPRLSRLVTAGDEPAVEETLSLGLRMVLFVTIPAAAALMVLRHSVVGTLFGRGEFGDRSVALTTAALLAYAIGLPAIGGARVLVSAFYARNDVARAVSVAAVSFAANLGFLALFYGPLAHQGVALAGSGAAWVSWVGLLVWYRCRHGRLQGGKVLGSAAKALAAGGAMALALHGCNLLTGAPDRGWQGALYLLVVVPVGAAVYFTAAAVLRSRETGELLEVLRRRRERDV